MAGDEVLVLSGKRAVITGAGRGVGRAIALALASVGADVALTARTVTELEALAREIEAMGRRALVLPCDVTDAAQVAYMAEVAQAEPGPIDILVNNAGMAGSHKFLDHPDDLWHRTLALNLTGVYYACKAFVPAMVERRVGRIINIASIAAKVGGRYTVAYTASKHGVLGLTRSLALELAPYNITVNAICPGWVDTPMTRASIANIASRTGMTPDEARETLESASPQRRLVQPEEIAAVAVFLAQDSSHGITGQAINVDGGTVMW
jgi:NAD(P)-dependent dehydrogenase (short-subunit alcohol dehydrogenase family)